MADMDQEFFQTYPYKVPDWASHLKNVPANYVKLSNLNTPIHKWNLSDIPEGVSIHIKRDDLTGAELTGNKVRCLQIMFAEALQEGCKHIVTGGGSDSGQCRAMSLACRALGLTPHIISEAQTVRCLQIMFAEALQEGCKHIVTGGGSDSGQCRAMSLACRALGLTPHIISEAQTVRCLQIMFAEALQDCCKHIVTGGGSDSGQCRAMSLACRALGLTPHIISEAQTKEELARKGNALLYRIAGSHIYLTPFKNFESFQARVYKMAEFIRTKYQEKCYPFPVGGSSVKGMFGFISLFEELLKQGLHERFDDIVLSIATCPTSAGLAVANYLTGSKVKIHSISVGLSNEVLTSNIDALLRELGLNDVKTNDIVDIIVDYIGDGYGTVSEEVLNFITKVSSTTGILLDPYYTAKGAYGMVEELRKNPNRFKGNRILFIHTGGMFGLFSGELDRILDQSDVTTRFMSWPDADVPPWDLKKNE